MVAWREILLEVNVPTDQSLWKKSGYGKTKTPEVVELQKWLNANGYNAGAEDGVYGKGTANAVRAFQKKSGLGVDGDAGPATLKAMQGAGNQPQAQPQAQTPAQTGVDGPADATAASKPSDASDPPEAAFGAGQQPASTTQTQPQATQTQPQAANTAATANDKDGTTKTTPAPATTQGADGPADATAQAGASDATAPPQQPAKSQTPVAAPKVSDEKFIQKGGDTTNFNVAKMKAKYPTPYVDIPQQDGTVIRGYGNPKDLEAYMQGDGKRTGAKIVGGKQPAAQPQDNTTATDAKPAGEETPKADTTKAPDTKPGEETPKTDTTTGGEQTGANRVLDVNGKKMTQNEIAKRMNELIRKAQASAQTAGIDFTSSIARMLHEALSQAELQELQALVDAVKNDKYFSSLMKSKKINAGLIAAGVKNVPGASTAPSQSQTKGGEENTGSKYTKDGKPVSRDEYEKTFGKDVSGRYNDYERIMNQIKELPRQAEDEKRKWTQAALDNPDSPYYSGVPTEEEDPEYPKELKAIDDKYKAQGDKLKAKADKLASDPDVKKMIDQGGDPFYKAMEKDDDAFDKLLDKEDDFWDDDKDLGVTKDKKVVKKGNKTTTTTSSSTSTVTRTGGSSTTTSTSGGGSVTRFAKVMKDGPDTKKLKAERKELRKKERAFVKQWRKDNPDADRFDVLDTPEYKEIEAELDSYEGMDGKIAKSKVMKHPGGEIRNGKLTYFNPKGGKPMKWDGEQYKPRNESIDNEHSRLVELAGIKTQPEIDYDIVDDAHVHMRNDKDFYRTKYFPSMCKMATLSKGSKSYDPKLIIMPLVNDGINSYCKKYNIAKMPDEVFKQDHRKALYDKIYSEEMKEIEKGEYV